MSRQDKRLAAEAAFVVRRLVSEELVEIKNLAEGRRAVETVLLADRERERELDREVEAILRANARTIQTAGADYNEMFKKAKRMLAAKKKIPL